jgi:3-isopropylmalate/(R)-2-methylmalate dehydratase small subunit
MEAFKHLTSRAVPFPFANVDTDMIFPSPNAERMKALSLERDSPFYAQNGFANLRYAADGSLRPDCVFNQPRYQAARILIALENFACGSSREMAVWSLMDMGFRCVIAPSFGDIFYSNACINGLLPVRVPREFVIQALKQADAEAANEFTVDLEQRHVRAPNGATQVFEIDAHRRECLLKGLDEIGHTLGSLDAIERHELERRLRRPWLVLPDIPTSM